MSADAPGFYGKLPARGDFLSRRVPAGVAQRWDQWLGLMTSAVREAAGADWPEAWLTAPLWHFALGGEMAPPHGAAGVMIASTDRVGRMFPFTIIGPSHGEPDADWQDAIEALVMEALAEDFDPATLDLALQQLGPPRAATPLMGSQSVWWCRGSDRVAPVRLSLRGWPGRDDAVAMVLGGAAQEVE